MRLKNGLLCEKSPSFIWGPWGLAYFRRLTGKSRKMICIDSKQEKLKRKCAQKSEIWIRMRSPKISLLAFTVLWEMSWAPRLIEGSGGYGFGGVGQGETCSRYFQQLRFRDKFVFGKGSGRCGDMAIGRWVVGCELLFRQTSETFTQDDIQKSR